MTLAEKLRRAIRVGLRHLGQKFTEALRKTGRQLTLRIGPTYYSQKRGDLNLEETAWLTSLANQLSSRWLVHYSSSGNALGDEFIRHGTGKQGTIHGAPYWDLYYEIFASARNSIESVFECGIGSTNPLYKYTMGPTHIPGASLRAWRDFFPHAQIYGVDIDPDVLLSENRITTLQMDQTNPDSIASAWGNFGCGPVDVIVDDGLHEPHGSFTLFDHSIGNLKPLTGVYIIEDVSTYHLSQYAEHFSKPSLEFKIYSLLGPPPRSRLNKNNPKLGGNSVITIRKK